MKAIPFLLLIGFAFLASCKKQDLTQTQVGFYVFDTNYLGANDDGGYELYIDQQFKGNLQVSATESSDANLMNMQTLDAKRHVIEVRKNNALLSSTYLQITGCGGKSGTHALLQGAVNGAKYRKEQGMGFATYAIMQ